MKEASLLYMQMMKNTLIYYQIKNNQQMNTQIQEAANKMGVCDTCGAIQFLSYITCNYNGVCKGKIIPQTESKEVSDIKVPVYFKELGVLPKKDTAYIAGALDFGNFKQSKEVSNEDKWMESQVSRHSPKQKEQPVSVEEAAKFMWVGKELIFNTDVFNKTTPTITDAANWQKEQDKAIIVDLLESLKDMCGRLEWEESDYLPSVNFHKAKSAINTATNYINQ